MNGWWKLGLAVAVGAAIAVPASVIAGGSTVTMVGWQSIDQTGRQETNSKDFKTIPGLSAFEVNIDGTITVSAEMAKGRAKFRARSGGNAPSEDPALAFPRSGVQFAAPGANAYQFISSRDCGPTTVEWRRVGSQRAVLSKATVHAIGDGGC